MLDFYKFCEILNEEKNINEGFNDNTEAYHLYHGVVSEEFLPKIKKMVDDWMSAQDDFYPPPKKENVYRALELALRTIKQI